MYDCIGCAALYRGYVHTHTQTHTHTHTQTHTHTNTYTHTHTHKHIHTHTHTQCTSIELLLGNFHCSHLRSTASWSATDYNRKQFFTTIKAPSTSSPSIFVPGVSSALPTAFFKRRFFFPESLTFARGLVLQRFVKPTPVVIQVWDWIPALSKFVLCGVLQSLLASFVCFLLVRLFRLLHFAKLLYWIPQI